MNIRDQNLGNLVHPAIRMADAPETPKGMKVKEVHDALLDYLMSRLNRGRVLRDQRIQRYSRVDKSVATWQRLNEEDQKRDEKEMTTGEPQAITSVIPILHTHLEDMASFYAGVFSPNARDFYAIPQPEASDQLTALVDKMNADAKYCGYYLQLTSMLRSILKYNMAGVHIDWRASAEPNGVTLNGNHVETLDMYNTFWDPTIKIPSKVAKEAEWAASACIKNRFWLVKEGRKEGWWRLDAVIEDEDSMMAANAMGGPKTAMFYRFPPQDAMLGSDGSPENNLLDQYFAGIDSGVAPEISGHEVIRMYCRLNPTEWDLLVEGTNEQDQEGSVDTNAEYQLWKFTIVDGKQICYAERVKTVTDEIPMYLGFLNVDEMGEATKSIAELLRSFQGFISFLFNIHVAGARGSIWGFTAINPKFYDSSQIKKGDVAGILTMKSEVAQAHINPSQGIARIQNNAAETRTTMTDVGAVMNLMQLLFPSQNQPSQIAGIDRAIESQVAAVLQGMNRRLHMLANTLDSQIAQPMRMAAYYNIGVLGDQETKAKLTGLAHQDVLNALGSGLKQINREQAAKAMERVIFAIIQNPQTVQDNNMDVLEMIDYWADLLDLNVDMTQFKKPQPAVASEAQAVDAQGQPIQQALPSPGAPPAV